jgi:hypothetical protein
MSVRQVVMGRAVQGASLFAGKLSMGRADHVHGLKCPWSKMSVERNVLRAKCPQSKFVHGVKFPWGEMSWVEFSWASCPWGECCLQLALS